MISKLKPFLYSLITLSLLLTSAGECRSGGADVGGGDTIRAFFLNAGDSVVKFLSLTPEGQKIVSENKLKIETLRNSLNVNTIQVVDAPLIDRTGSLVDALGQPGLIQLNKSSWALHIERNTDIYFLVFHEMLRENGINDDNYIISKLTNPFPENLKLKKSLIPNKSLIDSDNLANVILKDKIANAGPGCPVNSYKTFSQFDSTNNQFEIYPNEMTTNIGANGRSFDRSSCQIAIPFKASAGKKVIITQVDLLGDVELEKEKNVQVSAEIFSVGGIISTQTKKIQSNNQSLNGGFLFRETLSVESSCGGEGILRLNSNLLIQEAKLNSNLPESSKTQLNTSSKVSYAKIGKITLSFKSVNCIN